MLYLDVAVVAALAKPPVSGSEADTAEVPSRFRVAAKFVDQVALGLSAGDALHLAVASEHGATVHTVDNASPARAQGWVPTRLS